jgi:hypothetical protein
VHRIITFIKRLTYLCLLSLNHRFVAWTKPDTTSLLLGTLTDLARSRAELVAENALLRKPLIILRRQVKRPACTKTDRMLLVLLARAVRTWKQALFIVQPETLLRWHHQGFQLYWRYKSRAVQRFMVVDNLDFSPTRLTAFSVRHILAFRGALPSPHFSTTRILMALHVFVFLLVFCLLFSLARLGRLDRFHLRPFFSRGEAKRSSLPRLLKPRTPDDCPACRLASTASSAGEPAEVATLV